MKYISKKAKKYLEIKLKSLGDNEYEILALSDNDTIMGKATFVIKPRQRTVWLRKIETYPQFQDKGVGQALLDVLEYFTVSKGLRHIEGKFYPDNEFAKPFYLKNDYDIYKEDYETYVEKYLNPEPVVSTNKKRILGFEVIENEKEM